MLSLWAQYELDGDEKHIKAFRSRLAHYIRVGSRLAVSYMQTLLARMSIKAGLWQDAGNIIDKSIKELNRQNEHFFRADIFRLKALISEKLDSATDDETEAYFLEALQTAQRQNALGLQLRSTMDYCRHLQRRGQTDEARRQLSEIMEKISEGMETRDYQRAENLLQELDTTHNRQPQPEAI